MRSAAYTAPYGVRLSGRHAEFRVWAPAATSVVLRFEDGRTYRMLRDRDDTFAITREAEPGERYFYQVDDNRPVPDPVSRLLPEGVHGPTEITDPDRFRWNDSGWRGLDLADYIIYELHPGTFTPQGNFAGIVERLDYLLRLGVTAVEIMPVATFPGTRNWGYDAVSSYAVQADYGGPDGLKQLIDAAHQVGLAVIVDVIYNHLGNEGNYLRLFGPYFTSRHHTPWGEAINFDDAGSEHVRRYFIENALYWIREYHADGLRLDAIQTIKDDSPVHIVQEISDRVHEFGQQLDRRVCVIAETDENDASLLWPKSHGGFGLDAAWSDDFHHAVHTVLTGENKGYYQDFGKKEQVVRALNEGFVFQGENFQFWGKPRGTRPENVPLPAHVISTQNHDQVGNRAKGERLGQLGSPGAEKLAAALLLLSPHTPLLFMGQEFAETAPFQFFTDYGDPALQRAVSQGRRNEFKEFSWDEVPDPQDPATFERSRLHWELASDDNPTLRWYRQLITLRKQYVTSTDRTCRAELNGGNIVLQVPHEQPHLLLIAGFRDGSHNFDPPLTDWKLTLENSEDGYTVKVFTRK